MLHFTSCHPFRTKKGIPYNQALRLRRICSNEEQFDARCSELKDWLFKRGYDEQLVTSQIERAKAVDRDTALFPRRKEDGERVYLVLTYHPAISRNIYNILRKNHNILNLDSDHRRIFNSLPLVSFRRCKTLQDILVRAKLDNNISGNNIYQGCKKPRC